MIDTLSSFVAIVILFVFDWAKWYGVTYLFQLLFGFGHSVMTATICFAVGEVMAVAVTLAKIKRKNENPKSSEAE